MLGWKIPEDESAKNLPHHQQHHPQPPPRQQQNYIEFNVVGGNLVRVPDIDMNIVDTLHPPPPQQNHQGQNNNNNNNNNTTNNNTNNQNRTGRHT
ncbi:unnamed protein product [Meloidogyne enterolobii]|uniref:Uncharacterized protein n=1 Tax=Meloidogyne enterolobii TaxID=390850 RepID=A0ACB0XYP5_MELEN